MRGRCVSGHVVQEIFWGVSRPFVSDTSPKCIDREGLERRRTGTKQHERHCLSVKELYTGRLSPWKTECLHVFLGNTTFHKRAQTRWLYAELLSRKINHDTRGVIFPYDSAHTEPPKDVLHFLFIAVSKRLIVSHSPFQESPFTLGNRNS